MCVSRNRLVITSSPNYATWRHRGVPFSSIATLSLSHESFLKNPRLGPRHYFINAILLNPNPINEPCPLTLVWRSTFFRTSFRHTPAIGTQPHSDLHESPISSASVPIHTITPRPVTVPAACRAALDAWVLGTLFGIHMHPVRRCFFHVTINPLGSLRSRCDIEATLRSLHSKRGHGGYSLQWKV